ncbi:5-formyltetrahydrofolate cyclo-ligase [Anaerotignum lactatifermentans]|uniref:5-formyltetrahydrofolate cyclo-ligase n=1 Tax=Anaerotignum lactatifermentans TaxID=160404 RepID=A0ABS2G6M5_9FIRM|nr:5-formyltetrahydrofolate cyclo-ligase [Anaerotignum lactatifermentans]MBM6828782.1 5-formyltetrahydrofolate cyclo-ligase [Anaerotignum lactatifermentans]MBM6877109.1 5-formyltetrahydrofolate cyclo-ligase [Anaerotignum lactatifermentans]MBM6950364.1 5-formyltetrahydrofolate cyclo-ligase [Anaerotignum lactatifermentans]
MKKILRQKGKENRDSLSPAERAEKSRRIAENILKGPIFSRAQRVFSYLPMGTEADTMPILEAAWRMGKQVAVPVCEKKRQMYFVVIGSIMETEVSAYGIREPRKGREWEVTPEPGDLFLVPALLFDRNGYRLGYGGGYYDTYFAEHPVSLKIGCGFSCQIYEGSLPREETDLPVDWIVTENGWLGGKK